jgi:putative copper resistance protein D
MSALIGIAIPTGTFPLSLLPSFLTHVPAHLPLPGESAGMVLWVLPVVKLIFSLAAAGAIGTLVLTCIGLSPRTLEYRKALNFAAVSAAVWTMASVASAILAYLDVAPGVSLSDDSFGPQFGYFLTTVGLGQTWLMTVLIAAAVTVLCLVVANVGAVAWVTVLAVAGLVPLTFNSHPNFGAAQGPAMAALGLHIISAAVWMGGLTALVALRPALKAERLVVVVRRFSTLALIFFIVLAASGFLQTAILVGTFENLWSPYGLLVVSKGVALLVLGVAGFVQRRWLISRMASNQARSVKYFWALVAGELLVLGIASGLAAALTRTDDSSPDVPTAYATLAEKIVDYPLPAAPTLWHYLLEMRFDPIWVLLCCAGIFVYLAGVRRLHQRGESWPRHRTSFWLVGVLALLYVSNGGVNAYREFLFSAQTVAQMMLIAIIPLFLVLAAPLVLANQTIRSRTDGSRGGREWITVIAGSRLISLATTPFAAAGILLASLVAFYYPPLLGWGITDHIGHQWVIVYLLFVGTLVATSVIRSRALPPTSFVVRLSAVAMVIATYTILGIVLSTSTGLLQADWYGALAGPWGVDSLQDQQGGGVIVLSIGILHSVVLAILIVRTRYPDRSPTPSSKEPEEIESAGPA